MGDVIVFAGPCLAGCGEELSELVASVEVRPPAQRGDVLQALADQTKVIVLLDGLYYNVRAVTHKELLYAIAAGVQVVGAASMGALRAAELRGHGMTGVGQVFDWFDSGFLDGDDEVALLHTSGELGYRPLTLALVELRYSLDLLVGGGELSSERAEVLVRKVKSLPFSQRDWELRVRPLAKEVLGQGGCRQLEQCLGSNRLKETDAIRALRVAHRLCRTSIPVESPRVTLFTNHHRESYLAAPSTEPNRPTIQQAWHTVQLLHPQADEFVWSLRVRFLLASSAIRAGLEVHSLDRERLQQRLSRHLLERYGRQVLPESELAEEADQHALAKLSHHRYGSVERAIGDLAQQFGWTAPNEMQKLMELFEIQDDLIPPWFLIRAFVFSEAMQPAWELAHEAAQIQRAFRSWAKGSRIRERELVRLCGELWQCASDEVEGQAKRRGLFNSRAFMAGFREAVELVAAAERLPRPINAYRECKERLIRTPLTHFLGLDESIHSKAPNFSAGTLAGSEKCGYLQVKE